MIKGFRDFIMRGNVIDLAVAVIIGAAFTAIVTSFVTNVLTPLIASLVGKPDFSALVLYLNGGKINYGIFLNSVISFLLQAAVVYFVIVVPMNYVMRQLKGKPPVADPTEKTCVQCKSLVPITATRCKFCTQPIWFNSTWWRGSRFRRRMPYLLQQSQPFAFRVSGGVDCCNR